MAGLGPQDIDVAELHDAFTILEIAESEEVGFFPKGEGHLALEKGETALGGKMPINVGAGSRAAATRSARPASPRPGRSSPSCAATAASARWRAPGPGSLSTSAALATTSSA